MVLVAVTALVVVVTKALMFRRQVRRSQKSGEPMSPETDPQLQAKYWGLYGAGGG